MSVEKKWEEILAEVNTPKEMKAFLGELELNHDIGFVTGGGGEGKTCVVSVAGQKLKARVRPVDRDVFSYYLKYPDDVAERIEKFPDFVHESNIEKLEHGMIKFHVNETCSDVEKSKSLLLAVEPHAKQNFTHSVLTKRKSIIFARKGWSDSAWLSTDAEQEPDCDRSLLDSFALWDGFEADSICNIVSSRPDLASFLVALRQGIYVPKELYDFIQTGATIDDAIKKGIHIPYELGHFMNAMDNQNEAVRRIREPALKKLQHLHLINNIVLNVTNKTEEEIKNAIKSEIGRLSTKVRTEFLLKRSKGVEK